MTFFIEEIDVEPLFKAIGTFEKFRKHLITDQDKAGSIQAFEFSFELAWKTMKRILAKKGVEVRSPKDCFREAALNKMINDPRQWFKFLEKRNLTVHSYNELVVHEIIKIFDEFSSSLSEFIDYLKDYNV